MAGRLVPTRRRTGFVSGNARSYPWGGGGAPAWRISADFAEQDRRAFSREYLRSAVAPDLAALWRDLGLKLQGESLAFDDAAPLAAILKSITEARDNYGTGL
jgi:hypothetical protein